MFPKPIGYDVDLVFKSHFEERSRVISSLFVIPWRGTEPTSASRKEQRPALLLRDFVGDAGTALLRVAFERFETAPAEFSPLVFYGPSGTGKSHLAWLLAARASLMRSTAARTPAARATRSAALKSPPVYWATGADFVRQVAHAIEADGVPDFRRRILSSPAFILDGLDAVAGRGPAQGELLVLLDECRALGIPVVATASTLPLELAELSASLASRLQAGLVVPLQSPGPAARQQLLAQFALKLRFSLPVEAQRRIQERFAEAAGVRPTAPELYELVRALAKLGAEAEAEEAEEDATPKSLAARAAAYRACVDQFADRWGARPSLSLKSVSQAVAEYFGIKPAELKGPSRRQMVVRARGVAIYLGRQLAGESLDRLGEHFGGRDHTTALHAVRKTEELLAADPNLRKAVDDLMQQLQPE